jgi:hypothetical protein
MEALSNERKLTAVFGCGFVYPNRLAMESISFILALLFPGQNNQGNRPGHPHQLLGVFLGFFDCFE